MRLPELRPYVGGWHLSGQFTDHPTCLICRTCDGATCEGREAGGKLSGTGDLDIQLRGYGGGFWEPDPAVAAAERAADTCPELGGCLTFGAEIGERGHLHAGAGLHVGAWLGFGWLV